MTDMMHLSVATNWDIELLDGLKELSHVKNVFGKMPLDIIGGGRAHQVLPTIDKEGVKRHVEEAHKRGLTFTYLLNANCLGNIEHKPEEQGKIYNFLGWLSDIEVDAVTLTNPILIRLVKKSFPKLKIGVSVYNQVIDVWMACIFEDQGCDYIEVSYFINREFEMLKKIREKVKCELHLLVQNACLYFCPGATEHSCFMSHISNIKQNLLVEYYSNNCILKRLKEPEEYIKSRWIRPEDLKYYEELGFHCFKIINSSKSTPWLLNAVKAYNGRKYEGNLVNILSLEYQNIDPLVFQKVGYPYIDNQALDGFLEWFKKVNCRLISCKDCGYCKRVADKVIKFDQEARKEYIRTGSKALECYIKSFESQATNNRKALR